ncbi:MAG: hypothetical protein WBX22_25735 [Silvibacterium sp.]
MASVRQSILGSMGPYSTMLANVSTIAIAPKCTPGPGLISQRFERTVDRDNAVSFHNLVMQIEPAEWRGTMAGCKGIIYQHLNATLTLTIGDTESDTTERKESS